MRYGATCSLPSFDHAGDYGYIYILNTVSHTHQLRAFVAQSLTLYCIITNITIIIIIIFFSLLHRICSLEDGSTLLYLSFHSPMKKSIEKLPVAYRSIRNHSRQAAGQEQEHGCRKDARTHNGWQKNANDLRSDRPRNPPKRNQPAKGGSRDVCV